MKRNQVTLAVLLAALSWFAASSANALPQSQVTVIKRTVADAPAAELAAKAADLVSQASAQDKQEVMVTAVREIASKRPATIVAVIGAMAKAAPDLSASAAAEAVKLVGEKAPEIAKAAAAGAPDQAERIASAVAQVAPRSAAKVTRAVVTTVPNSTSRVVESVIRTVPSSQTEIKRDATITRISERMAAQTGSGGTITTLPGTISGRPAPSEPPVDSGTPTVGSDPQRRYGAPQ